MKHTRIGLLLLSLLLLLALTLAACNSGDTTTDTTVEDTTAAPTEAPTEADTEAPTEAPTDPETTEAPTEAPTEPEETESHLPTREDWAEDDPQNPYYNLIEVGTSYDGKTPCYDGRYDFGYTVCYSDDGIEFSSVQDAVDWIVEYGGNIAMVDNTNVCLKLDIPEDGYFYRLAFNWLNCDFVMNYGVIYDDQNEKDGIVGYAYYSDLYKLDVIQGLEGTYVWIVEETLGMAPGRYMLSLNDDPDSELYYAYDFVASLEEWPGLPNGEILED